MPVRAERTLREHGDKVPADDARRAVDRLNESMQKIGQAVYASTGAGAGAGGPSGDGQGQSGPAEEGTVEGEFREV